MEDLKVDQEKIKDKLIKERDIKIEELQRKRDNITSVIPFLK